MRPAKPTVLLEALKQMDTALLAVSESIGEDNDDDVPYNAIKTIEANISVLRAYAKGVPPPPDEY
jgi:hypothetical protein